MAWSRASAQTRRTSLSAPQPCRAHPLTSSVSSGWMNRHAERAGGRALTPSAHFSACAHGVTRICPTIEQLPLMQSTALVPLSGGPMTTSGRHLLASTKLAHRPVKGGRYPLIEIKLGFFPHLWTPFPLMQCSPPIPTNRGLPVGGNEERAVPPPPLPPLGVPPDVLADANGARSYLLSLGGLRAYVHGLAVPLPQPPAALPPRPRPIVTTFAVLPPPR
jgi:hypothetical protein